MSASSPKRKVGSSSAMRASASSSASRSFCEPASMACGDHRLVRAEPLQHQRVRLVGEGVAGPGLLEAGHREDLPCPQRRDALLLRRVHEEHAGDLLEPLLAGVPDRVALGHPARVDADEDVPPPLVEERDLEGQRQQRAPSLPPGASRPRPCPGRVPPAGARRAGREGSRTPRPAPAGCRGSAAPRRPGAGRACRPGWPAGSRRAAPRRPPARSSSTASAVGSSWSATASTRLCRAASPSGDRPSVTSKSRGSSGSPKRMVRRATRSSRPAKAASAPSGRWTGAMAWSGKWRRREASVISKSAPTRSILLAKAMRGTR